MLLSHLVELEEAESERSERANEYSEVEAAGALTTKRYWKKGRGLEPEAR